MQQSVSTQTNDIPDDHSDMISLRPSTSGHHALSTFDPTKEKDKLALREWCHCQWTMTFHKSLAKGNSIHYHECCICFSKRIFVKLAGHPQLQSASVLRIPTFKEINSADSLYRWLLARLEACFFNGRLCYFPTINRFHIEDDELEAISEFDNSDLVYLRKRFNTERLWRSQD